MCAPHSGCSLWLVTLNSVFLKGESISLVEPFALTCCGNMLLEITIESVLGMNLSATNVLIDYLVSHDNECSCDKMVQFAYCLS